MTILDTSRPEHQGAQFPEPFESRSFMDAEQAVDRLQEIYDRNLAFLRENLLTLCDKNASRGRIRATYPAVHFDNSSHARLVSTHAYGYVTWPGHYETTITRPDLYRSYLIEQLGALIANYGVPVTIVESNTPIPIHFASSQGLSEYASGIANLDKPLLDLFDAPDLSQTNDFVANGDLENESDDFSPLALFTAPRIDYSLHRLAHYTATQADHFQNFVLFTNYQFYVDYFIKYANEVLESGEGGYESFVEPGGRTLRRSESGELGREGEGPPRAPQMPAYHLTRGDMRGITLVNIGVGPSNAKTITDHIAVLRPSAWLMIGHCAGLRSSQNLGDYVLAHAYVRDDHVLDQDLPLWVPIPPLAEIQMALEQAVTDVTGKHDLERKSLMRTGTVASTDNRNWELLSFKKLVRRFSQSRAIALDMESAVIAANGFRLRVPYGTLLCISDKPLHGEIKLPGMADRFYRRQVEQHLLIAIRAVEHLRSFPIDRIHSRKLRSFSEPAFL